MVAIPPINLTFKVGDKNPDGPVRGGITRPKKATNRPINLDFLKHRVAYSKSLGYEKPKWIEFCEVMLVYGYTLTLYEARETVSKYITVSNGTKSFKVRFSNHKPIKARELQGDCDCFVGRTNLGVTTTHQAIQKTLQFFNGGNPL